MAIPLLLDTDIGDDVDDVIALLQAVRHPDVSLRGVATVLGDTPHRARIARKVLDLAGRPDVPVAAGERFTLGGRTRGPITLSGADFVAPEGSAEWEALGRGLVDQDGPTFLIETIRAAPEPLVVCTIGPLTNLALALRRAPDLTRKVRGLVVAGGRLGPDAARGNYNFGWDHEAVRLVLSSGAPLKIGTNDITEQVLLHASHLPRLQAGPPACRAAADQLARHFQQRQRDWTCMYDPVALTLAYTDQYVATRPMALTITSAEQRVVLGVDEAAPPTAEASVAVDVLAVTEHILAVLGA